MKSTPSSVAARWAMSLTESTPTALKVMPAAFAALSASALLARSLASPGLYSMPNDFTGPSSLLAKANTASMDCRLEAPTNLAEPCCQSGTRPPAIGSVTGANTIGSA